jgi:hypothetical protein
MRFEQAGNLLIVSSSYLSISLSASKSTQTTPPIWIRLGMADLYIKSIQAISTLVQ